MDFIGIDYFMPIAISALISSRNSYICPECDNPCYIYSPCDAWVAPEDTLVLLLLRLNYMVFESFDMEHTS